MELIGKNNVVKINFAVYFSTLFIILNCSEATKYDTFLSKDVSLKFFHL
ncbi:hypothetical protein Cal6303_4949 [Calothrix sp. PCC 6303]|nr:hypothetical protein Cal6303_4949 [Calothrix sp. PCC 6303]